MGVGFNVFPLHPAALLRGYPQRPSLRIAPFNSLLAVVLRIGVPATATIFACAVDGPLDHSPTPALLTSYATSLSFI